MDTTTRHRATDDRCLTRDTSKTYISIEAFLHQGRRAYYSGGKRAYGNWSSNISIQITGIHENSFKQVLSKKPLYERKYKTRKLLTRKTSRLVKSYENDIFHCWRKYNSIRRAKSKQESIEYSFQTKPIKHIWAIDLLWELKKKYGRQCLLQVKIYFYQRFDKPLALSPVYH